MSRITDIVLAASVLGLGSSARADEAEDKAAAFVQGLGGKVVRDQKEPGKPVVEVDLSFNKKVTDASLKKLAALKSAMMLQLYDTKVTDAGLKDLAGFKNLIALLLARTQVTDAGLKQLARIIRGLF